MIKEFRPALMFLAKFLVIYFLANTLYGVFVESYKNNPDFITRTITLQSAWLLKHAGYSTGVEDHPTEPKVRLQNNRSTVLNVFEGCNGINVMIVFVAFIFAFGGPAKLALFFLPSGILIIHIFNLLRITFLFYLSLNNSKHFYYYHKYFFTATLYLVVFALWIIWVLKFHEKQNTKASV